MRVRSDCIISVIVRSEFWYTNNSDGDSTGMTNFLFCWRMDLICQGSDLCIQSLPCMCIGARSMDRGIIVYIGNLLGNGYWVVTLPDHIN